MLTAPPMRPLVHCLMGVAPRSHDSNAAFETCVKPCMLQGGGAFMLVTRGHRIRRIGVCVHVMCVYMCVVCLHVCECCVHVSSV